MERIVCQKCEYYHVTWDKNKPHGCKFFGFKSKILPSMEVRNNSGINCNNFKLKSIFKEKKED